MSTDAELLQSYAKDGSNAAFEKFVRRHIDFVFAIARRKLGGDAHAAADVSQGVFIAAARRAAALARHGSTVGWLYLTTRNLAAQRVRADRRREKHHAAAAAEALPDPRDSGSGEAWSLLDTVLGQLSEADREAVLLRFMEHATYAAIGRTLGVSEDAARMRVDRALERLRAMLGKYGAVSAGATLAVVVDSPLVGAPSGVAERVAEAAIRSAAGAGFGAGVTGFFSVKTISSAIVIAAIVAGFFVGTRLVRTSPETGSTVQAARARSASPLSLAARAPASLSQPTDGAHPAAPAPGGALSAKLAAARIEAAKGTRQIKSRFATPEARAAWIARAVAFYDPLIQKLELTPDQADAFKQALADNVGRRSDLTDVARALGAKSLDPDIQALRAEADTALLDQVRTSFGDAAATALQNYTNTGALRELTSSLASALVDTATPLTPVQADLLVDTMNAHQAPGVTRPTPRTLDLPSVLTDAQTFLTPSQMIAFRTALHTWH